MAPEVHEYKAHNGHEADLFAVGVILFQIVTGHSPFSAAQQQDLYYSQIVTGQADTFFEMNEAEHLSSSFKDLIIRMLAFDASDRLTVDELRTHAWVCEKTIKFEIQSSERAMNLTPRKAFQKKFQLI